MEGTGVLPGFLKGILWNYAESYGPCAGLGVGLEERGKAGKACGSESGVFVFAEEKAGPQAPPCVCRAVPPLFL